MPLTDYHDMVQTFASNRANHALGIGVLPRRSWRCDRLPDVQHPGLARKSFAIDLVPIPDQIPRAVLRPARLDQLSPRPLCGRMLRDIEMHHPSPPVATLPFPVAPEALTVARHHCLGPHHLQRTPTVLPQPRQHDPEEPVLELPRFGGR